MTPEAKVTQYLIRRVKAIGGETRKVSWEGRIGAPDRLVLLKGKAAWFELKALYGRANRHQLMEIKRLRESGQRVYLCFGENEVEDALSDLTRGLI